jgi:hypothetical protein
MKNIADAAFVVSVHDYILDYVRFNLRWKGIHDISDFDFDLLGEVVNYEAETENTGWVIVRSSHFLNDLTFLPLSQFGHAIPRSSNLAGCGYEIPLRRV